MERIYTSYRRDMLKIAAMRLRGDQEAEDAVQDAAEALMHQRNRPPTEREKGLAMMLADRAARGIFRHQNRQCRDRRATESLDPDNPSHDRNVAPSAEREALARMALSEAVAAASPAVLMVGAGYTSAEVAAAEGCRRSSGAVRWSVNSWRREHGGEV